MVQTNSIRQFPNDWRPHQSQAVLQQLRSVWPNESASIKSRNKKSADLRATQLELCAPWFKRIYQIFVRTLRCALQTPWWMMYTNTEIQKGFNTMSGIAPDQASNLQSTVDWTFHHLPISSLVRFQPQPNDRYLRPCYFLHKMRYTLFDSFFLKIHTENNFSNSTFSDFYLKVKPKVVSLEWYLRRGGFSWQVWAVASRNRDPTLSENFGALVPMKFPTLH